MGLGNVHFSDKEHIEKLFYKFTIENMELKKVLRHIPDDNHIFACWNFTAKKVEENE